MKKIYLLASLVCAALLADAQYRYSPASLGRQTPRDESTHAQQFQLSADRDVIYTNDFSDCTDWTRVNANDAGYLDFIEGINWQCGTAVPDGPAAIDPIESTTAANGYMLIDSDEFGGDVGGEWIENAWFQNAEPINCSSAEHVSISFETFYRMWDSGTSDGNEFCLVEVSNDGVTWPDPNTYEVSEAPLGTRFELWPDMSTQDPVDNPTVKVFDISEIAGNSSTVYLRFRWKGTWGYAWMVDDLKVFETFANDLSAMKAYTGDIFSDFEYASIPSSQVIPARFAAIVSNYGYEDQVDVNVNFNIDGVDYPVLDTVYHSTLDTVLSDYITYSDVPGTRTLTVSVPADEDNSMNSVTRTLEVTDNIYAHNTDDAPVERGFSIDDEVAIGAQFRINSDVQAGGIRVWFGPSTDPNTELQALIFEAVDGDIQNLSYVASSSVFNINAATIDMNDYMLIGFDEDGPADLIAGRTYVAQISKFESSDRLFVRADVLDEDFGTVNFGPFGVGDAVNWYIGYNWSPAVQIVMGGSEISEQGPVLAVENVASTGNIELMQNQPNPANTVTAIPYNLKTAAPVTLIVSDMTGRVVMSQYQGMRAAGSNRIELDVTQFGAGIYCYTLQAGNTSVTHQMMVK